MKHITVIDWDGQELRTAVGVVGRRGLREVTCMSLAWDIAEQHGLTAGSFSAVLHLLEGVAVRGRGVFLARRQHLESLSLAAPPTTDDELPELVENHLTAELGMGTQDAVHDYFTLDDDAGASRRIVITAMDGQVADEYRQLATKLRLSRPRLAVRAGGAAALSQLQMAFADEPTLLVVPSAEEIELAIIANGRLSYWRCIYCSPASNSASFRGLLADELVRTLAVAEEGLPGGQCVGRVAVYLSAAEDNSIVRVLREAVDLPVSRIVPQLADVEVIYQGEAGVPGRFAPLLGALAEEARGMRPAVDLLTRQTRARSKIARRPLVLGALAVLTAISLGSYVLWETVAQEHSTATKLAAELKGLQATIKKRQQDAEAWEGIQAWHEANIVWLDELRDLSVRFPPPGSAVLLDFSASPNAAGGAAIRLSGKARDPAVVTALDGALRDENRSVLSRNLREQAVSSDDPFLWRFESLITAQRRSVAAYREALGRSTLLPDGPAP